MDVVVALERNLVVALSIHAVHRVEPGSERARVSGERILALEERREVRGSRDVCRGRGRIEKTKVSSSVPGLYLLQYTVT